MDLKAKKRLKKLGAKNPKLKKRDMEAEYEADKASLPDDVWPPEDSPAMRPLPMAETINKLKAEDETYRARKAFLIERSSVVGKQEFVEYIKKFTDDGLDLALFAWGVLKAEGYEYGGCVIDIKAKIWACEYLTDRAFGKAQQNIKIDSSIHNASDDELLKEVRLLQEKLGKKVMDVGFKKEPVLGAYQAGGAAVDVQGICEVASEDKGVASEDKGV